ncbi:S1 family peptidase [Rubinisphaera margarita]|uniref:S1 family peptidase n=1 Tax=Rubinisphaera margarita TaxID=2909586 RepID=UPI001EE96263|nr:serine protease [Rubinisphaera margarita]MCG6158165.1 serine protease [Rubinisphaera margarita]
MSTVDRMLLHVVKIQTLGAGQCLTTATGFFYQQDGYLYLITARHVVDDPAQGHCPDQLGVSLHVDAENLSQTQLLSIPLYVAGVRQWYQHPSSDADLAAVTINDPHILSNFAVFPFRRADIVSRDTQVPLGQDALILGFPLGFQDTVHNLPIVRRALIASSFSHPFKNQPYFLTDARLHRGMSGSPVIARIAGDSRSSETPGSDWRLLGVHTSALDVSNRDPVQDDRLALNTSWYATLISEMLPRRSPANVSKSSRRGSNQSQ